MTDVFNMWCGFPNSEQRNSWDAQVSDLAGRVLALQAARIVSRMRDKLLGSTSKRILAKPETRMRHAGHATLTQQKETRDT